ncbi:Ankyrin repeat protein [Lasiodiplodia theobromae]|nr:Ankyrin repeat protein [Lasiodiplodia theobromae]KAF4541117.1 Ankyrin repeat protein [Lasiodiplodia theobromae]
MLLRKLLDIMKESEQLKEIRNVLDEIKMIRSVLKDQLKVVGSLKRIVAPDFTQSEKKFSDVLVLIRETDESFDVMEAHAKEVEKGLEHLLDLKQKQANLWEARSSREGAEEAAKQGRTILVFTVVTIIFLPLSFMASFFSLGISIFPKSDGENNFPIGWVSALLFGVSFAVSIPFVLLAFNIEKFSDAWTRLKHSTNKHTAFIFLKPLRESRRLPSESIRATGHKWYREWVSFIAKHDLPLKPNDEMEARLKREMEGQQPGDEQSPELIFDTDSSSEGEVTDDEEEMELIMRQDDRQSNLLRRMKS